MITLKNIKKGFKPEFWDKLNVLERSDLPDDYEDQENDLIINRDDEEITSYYVVCIHKIKGKDHVHRMGEMELDVE